MLHCDIPADVIIFTRTYIHNIVLSLWEKVQLKQLIQHEDVMIIKVWEGNHLPPCYVLLLWSLYFILSLVLPFFYCSHSSSRHHSNTFLYLNTFSSSHNFSDMSQCPSTFPSLASSSTWKKSKSLKISYSLWLCWPHSKNTQLPLHSGFLMLSLHLVHQQHDKKEIEKKRNFFSLHLSNLKRGGDITNNK